MDYKNILIIHFLYYGIINQLMRVCIAVTRKGGSRGLPFLSIFPYQGGKRIGNET